VHNLPNRDVALALAARGFHIFPCNADKTPKVKAWEQNAVASAFKIEAMWRNWPDALPAIPVGAHGLVVFDCDRRQDQVDGVQAFIDLCAANSIDTSKFFVVETPSTGLHFYFRTDVPYSNSRGLLPDGIDVRGVGGYVIAPGATLPDGRSYSHVAGSWDAIPPLPVTLASTLKGKSRAAICAPAVSPVATGREWEYAQAALADEIVKIEAMREGSGRNAALNQAAHSIGTIVGAGWIDRETVERSLWEASERNGYRAKDGDSAAWATLQSGLNDGIAKPRAPLPVDEVPQYIRDSVAMWIEAYKVKPSQTRGVTATPFSMMQARAILAVERISAAHMSCNRLPQFRVNTRCGRAIPNLKSCPSARNLALDSFHGVLWVLAI
jgi:hypothetical protein